MTEVFTKRVAAGGDDGHTNSSGTFDNSAAFYIFGNVAGVTTNVFIRFTNITIPQGAIIVSAKITVQAQATKSTTTVNVLIKGNAAGDAVAPTTAGEHSSKVRTTASVAWSPVAQTAGSNYDSPDFTSVLQEIINQPDWASGNALMLLIDENGSSNNAERREDTYNGDSANATLLTVEYTVPDGGAIIF